MTDQEYRKEHQRGKMLDAIILQIVKQLEGLTMGEVNLVMECVKSSAGSLSVVQCEGDNFIKLTNDLLTDHS